MKLSINLVNAVVATITTVIFAAIIVSAVSLQSTHTYAEQPEVVMAVAPIFPPVAIASNTSGKVVIEVQVDAMGTVSMAKIVDGDALFRPGKIYEATARRWQFAAAKDGVGLRTVRLTFVFKIMPKDAPPDELTSVFIPPYQVEVRHKPFEPVVDKKTSE